MEHQKYMEDDIYGDSGSGDDGGTSSTYRPFANLQELLKGKK
jgi:hypothetical protein